MSNKTLSTLSLVCFALAVLVSLAVPQTQAQTFQTFITVDVPGALGTVAADIDDAGDIVGFYVDSAGVHHGFIDVNGTINAVDVPGSTGTLVYGVSPLFNNIVGWYTDSKGMQHGFMLSQGQFSTIDVPGAIESNALSIYDFVRIVGAFRDRKGGVHGFQYSLATKGFTIIDFPRSRHTELFGVTGLGYEVGTYRDTSGIEHGLIKAPRGQPTRLDFPGAATTANEKITLSGLEIVGFHGASAAGPFHGHFGRAFGTLQSVDFPNATDTRCLGINDLSEIVGRYTDTRGVTHGFFAK